MSHCAIRAFTVLLLLGAVARRAADERPQLTLTLAASRSAYVLGEPVVLAGALKNTGRQPVKEYRADRPRHAEATEIFVSEDGVEFAQYQMGIYPSGKVQRSLETLRPNEAWTFDMRILYTYKRPSRLAFERRGKYYIKIQYPLTRGSAGGSRQVVQSNVVCVEIKAPEGADAKLWQEIGRPHFLYFIQSGLVQKEHLEVVPRAVELLRTLPKSGYRAALRWALQEYYRERVSTIGQLTAQQDPELEKIREVLGIPKEPEGPFPEDQRLDQLITYHFPQLTPLEEVLEVMSEKSGVGLRLASALKSTRRMASIETTETLRAFMRATAAHDSTWVRYGDGYKLVPAPKPK